MRLFHSKFFVFWRMNRENAPKTFFVRRRTQRMYLNFMENSFVSGCIIRENVPRTFL